jgi:glycosyltransferase involved in cell wall biosynthesis
MNFDQPELSVIVPVYNGGAFLDRCLGALSRSDFRRFECIVVDDGSTDDSAAIARKYGAIVVPLDDRGGAGRARNRGFALARGTIVVFIDADVCVHADTLGRMEGYFRDHPQVDAVIGSYDEEPADEGLVSQFKNLSHHYVHQRSRSDAWTFWTGCGAIRRKAFEQVGGFDERQPTIEDIELGLRLSALGGRIQLEPTIQVKHLKRWTLRSLVRTDLFDRGVPWFTLLLQHRMMPSDLNVTIAQRIKISLVYVAFLMFAAAVSTAAGLLPSSPAIPGAEMLALVALGLVAAVVVSDAPLYRFFARRRGVRFALATVPLQFLYYAYCGLAVVLGLVAYARGRDGRSR